jgi:cellulose 1,4-beta-cellobiosidase
MTRSLVYASTLTLASWATGCATADPGARQGNLPLKENAPTAETAQALKVSPASGPAAPAKNPFEGAGFFLDQRHVNNIMSSIEHAPEKKTLLERAATYPTGLWLDKIAALGSLAGWLDAAEAQQAAAKRPMVPVIVVYNLPNRDCSAKASGGELLAEGQGEARYRSEFIDEIAAEFAAHAEL